MRLHNSTTVATLSTATSYYKWLYSPKPSVPAALEMARSALRQRVLPDVARDSIEAEISPLEVLHYINKLHDKSPGPDSIPNLFWKIFAERLSFAIARMIAAAILTTSTSRP